MFINKPENSGLLILEISKIVMCEFWYDYVKPKYKEKAKLCYVDIDSFAVFIKPEHVEVDIAKVFEIVLIPQIMN